jgi:hypothetical protein
VYVDVRFHEKQEEREKMGEIGRKTLVPEDYFLFPQEPRKSPNADRDNQIRLIITHTKCEINGNI